MDAHAYFEVEINYCHNLQVYPQNKAGPGLNLHPYLLLINYTTPKRGDRAFAFVSHNNKIFRVNGCYAGVGLGQKSSKIAFCDLWLTPLLF
jgi:hypothetical protein